MRMPREGRLWARWGLDPHRGALDGVLLEWREDRITRCDPGPRPPADLPPASVHEHHILTPGLINAHAHLDYSYLAGSVPRGEGFADWLGCMRRSILETLKDPGHEARCIEAASGAIAAMTAEGITEVWDISTFDWGLTALLDSDMDGLVLRELIGGTPLWADLWEKWQAHHLPRLDAARAIRPGLGVGISPHSTYTLAPGLLPTVADWARERAWPVAIHLAESPEERALLVGGDGPLLMALNAIAGSEHDRGELLRPGPGAIKRADHAGLLGPATLAIHVNLPEPGDAQRLADSGAVAVFCPRSHAFFGYPAWPLDAYRRAGVRIALGTDSLASNDALSMRAELRTVLDTHAGVDPCEALGWITGAGLGEMPPFGGRGRLEPGRPMRAALWMIDAQPSRVDAEHLLHGMLNPATTHPPLD